MTSSAQALYSNPTLRAVVIFFLGAIMVAMLLRARRRLLETTLVESCWWAIIATLVITTCELAVTLADIDPSTGDWTSAARFCVYLATFCPTMAVLGAKRPQSRHWKFIVASLWGVLAMPAILPLVVRTRPFGLDTIWSWFLLVLILVGLVNYLPTRNWLPSLLYGMGQFMLFAPHLPGPFDAIPLPERTSGASLLALVCFAAATIIAHRGARRRASRRAELSPQNRLWLDFRDSYGAVWAMRIAERINASASMYNWDVVLRWDGFHPTPRDVAPRSNEIAPQTVEAVQKGLRNLLRRFVSPAWIDRRLKSV